MKIIDTIKSATAPLFSIEILPPLKGKKINSIFETMDALSTYKPSFVNVTYHREEYIYINRGQGLLEKTVTRKRPGTVGVCSAIKNKYNIEPVPHIICGGFSKQDTEDVLVELSFLDIENVLLLRGDPIKSESNFVPSNNGHSNALDLVKQVADMNQGKYLDPNMVDVYPSDFCIGVAGYPEKHYEAPSLNADLKWLKAKVDAGADYVVTQMFYDNEKYFNFVKKCRKIGIEVPIIPGIKPLKNRSQLVNIPKHFKIDLPDDLVDAVEDEKNDKNIEQIGTEWCIYQSKELLKAGVPVIHYYTMGKALQTQKVVKAVF